MYYHGSMQTETLSFTVQDFGLAEYETVWALQKDLVQRRIRDEIPDALLLGEHPPVITLGRGTHAENLLNPDIPVISVERGGDVTFHGPGQLIAYPIFKLPPGKRDLHAYLRDLEEALILTLRAFGLEGVRNPGWTGVWAQHPESGQLMKLASIGVAVRQWVTYHGIALNVGTDLRYFRQINPCGLESQVMTSLEAQLARPVSVNSVKPVFIEAMQNVFQ